MSRTQTINELFAILGHVLPQQEYPDLDAAKLEEIYSAIENDKDQKALLASELGFTIRKRSKTKVKDPDAPKTAPRKTGYSCFPGESDYKIQVEALVGTTNDEGDKITKIKAKAAIWKTLSEEDKDPFNQIATDANRDNGLPLPKKSSSPKEPKLTNQQLQEQLRLTQQTALQHGVTDLPAPPPKEVKPRKKKDSPQSSPVGEERVLSPPVQPGPNPVEIGSDSDSDSDTSDISPQEV